MPFLVPRIYAYSNDNHDDDAILSKNILPAQCLTPETTEFADVVDEIYKPASPKMWLKDVF